MRTPPRAGWRSGVGTAFAVALANPSLWLLGAVGFIARGGILPLLLVIVVLPTPVQVRQLLGEYLASSGLTPQFFGLLAPVGAAVLLLALGALWLAARAELAAFERHLADPESRDQLAGRAVGAARVMPAGRRGLTGRLFVIQLLAALALALAALPLAASLYGATMDELMRPTPGGAALYLRVIYAVRDPLLLLVPAVVLIDAFTATASRRLMIGHFIPGRPAARGLRSRLAAVGALFAVPLRRPLSVIGTAALAWVTSVGVLVPVIWALDVAWDAARAAYLGQRATIDGPALAWLMVITLVFAAIWAAALLMAGFASAVRAALWSAEGLR